MRIAVNLIGALIAIVLIVSVLGFAFDSFDELEQSIEGYCVAAHTPASGAGNSFARGLNRPPSTQQWSLGDQFIAGGSYSVAAFMPHQLVTGIPEASRTCVRGLPTYYVIPAGPTAATGRHISSNNFAESGISGIAADHVCNSVGECHEHLTYMYIPTTQSNSRFVTLMSSVIELMPVVLVAGLFVAAILGIWVYTGKHRSRKVSF